jgi:hypothetical protein
VLSSGDRSVSASYPAADAYQSYGGSTDLWGETLSFKDIDNSDFGVAIAAQRNATGGTTAGRIDHIRITVYYGSFTLPVTLQAFQATRQGETVRVSWKAETESGVLSYIVERSADGIVFKSIDKAQPKNQDGSQYAIADKNPIPGANYYRLKIEDLDGSYQYSGVVQVLLPSSADYRITPSPWTAGQDLYIGNPKNEKLTIRFYNERGEMLWQAFTKSRVIPTTVPVTKQGLVYYRIFNEAGQPVREGRLLVY